jgi:HlyD family secretion protein
MRARLTAEVLSQDELQLPTALNERMSDPEVAAIIKGQEAELTARRNTLVAQEGVLRKEISGLGESMRGYEAQAKSTRARLALFSEELKDKTTLLDRKLIRKTEVLNLQRAEAGLSGELGELIGRIGDAKDRIARARQQIVQLQSASIEKAVAELRQAESELDDVQEQIHAAEDVLNRTEIRAPVRGVVVKLNRHTPGGVVGPGDVILELLPANDELVIQARVEPRDISHVKAGQDALVRLTSLNQRLTPMIEGKVTYVSADTVPDSSAVDKKKGLELPRGDSFVVRVKVDEQDAYSKIENLQMTPGMPADLYIKTGQRTFFNYVLRPLLDSFSRAFREP